MKNVLFLAPLFILFSCTPTKTVEPESTGGNINAEAPYIWSSGAFPRNLKISNDFSDAEVANIRDMADEWETALENKKNFFNHSDRTPEVSKPKMNLDALGEDGVNGIYKIKHWPNDLSSGALAVTQLFGRRHNIGDADEFVRIEHADILINENLYDFRTDDSNYGIYYDLQTVVLHEMGHFLGLGHNYGNSIMYPSINAKSNNRTPKGIDITNIAERYNISLSSSAAPAIVASKKRSYKTNSTTDPGVEVRILMELRADGECVHYENGVEIKKHSMKR